MIEFGKGKSNKNHNPESNKFSMEDAVLLITAGYDHTIRFWEALSGLCYKTLQHPESQVNRVCISPDKRLVVAAGTINEYMYD